MAEMIRLFGLAALSPQFGMDGEMPKVLADNCLAIHRRPKEGKSDSSCGPLNGEQQ